MSRLQEYQLIGRKLPSEQDPQPKLYRMRIFASSSVVAKIALLVLLAQVEKGQEGGW